MSQCPVSHASKAATATQTWWPNQLNLKILNQRGAHDPSGKDFDYAREFKSLDLAQVKKDILNVITTSQDFWPADYGHYGPLMVRMAWHSAGTYRVFDGRGGANTGNLRFAPLNSWPDNANLDKAKRLLWPVKQKYGQKLSWADLMILTGNVALESMGFKTLGFAGGRQDVYAPEEDVYWGPEEQWLAEERYHGGKLDKPLGAVQMGLIYVNPQGPGGNSDPLSAASHIRETFGRMGMNDEETVALIAGGHSFGKAHGAADADKYIGPEPEGAALEEQGFGWTSTYASGKGADAITSGLEGAWTAHPIRWDNGYFENLFGYEWKQVKSPGGAIQWEPTDPSARDQVPDAHNVDRRHFPIMFTTDLALKHDPKYASISKRFFDNPTEFANAFAKAWYKLTHRDMGPVTRCLGPEVAAPQMWQDPVPPVTHQLVNEYDIQILKQDVLNSGLTVSQLIRTAWASACTYRGTDHRGGANGARIRLPPQNNWEVNNPREISSVLKVLEGVQNNFNMYQSKKKVSMADMIVLGGCAGLERAIQMAGSTLKVPFSPGRTDALLEETDVASFAVLEPTSDGFRNYFTPQQRSAEEMLVDRAHLLTLTAPEMTVLVGGMRALNANAYESPVGVLTNRPGILTNDFFVNLLDMSTSWHHTKSGDYEGRDVSTGRSKWTASRVDLIFGSNSQLRAIAEYYACNDCQQVFVQDFVSAWNKVMNLDRFDLTSGATSPPNSRL